MALSGKQKKYLKKNIHKLTVSAAAEVLGVPKTEIEKHLLRIWGKEKYQKFSEKNHRKSYLQKRIIKFSFKEWFRRNKYIIPLLSFLVFAVYANSLGNDFVSDDIRGILENPRINSFSQSFPSALSLIKFFQPAQYLLTNKIFGLNPFFFRLPSVFFHLGSVIVVYFIILLLFNKKTALFASSLFAVHPILSEAIVWISGGIHVQYSFFVLLSILFYILSVKNKRLLYLSLLSGLLSLSISEKAIILPFLLAGIEFVYRLRAASWKKIALLATPIIGLGIFYASSIPSKLVALKLDYYQGGAFANPLRYLPLSITSYLELIFWPKGLTLYHTEMSVSSVEFAIRWVLFSAFIGLIIVAFKKNKSLFYWLSFFIVSLAPTLTPFGISWFVAERYVYLGTIGIIVTVSFLLNKLYEKDNLKPLVMGMFSIAVVALFARTVIRNTDWRNQDSLWLAAAKTSPSSHQNHNNLGDMYGRHGDLEKAVEEFKRAIELKPNYADAYHNLGNTYLQQEKYDLAIEYYQKAAVLNPRLWQSHQNLAGIYFRQKKYDLAEASLKKAAAIFPNNSQLHYNLAITYLKLNKKAEAKKELEQTLKLSPGNPSVLKLLQTLNQGN